VKDEHHKAKLIIKIRERLTRIIEEQKQTMLKELKEKENKKIRRQ
jgi:hypothetical protein